MTEVVREAAVELLEELGRLEPPTAGQLRAGDFYPQVAAALDRCLDQLRQTGLVGRANETPSSVLWNVAGHILARGWLQARDRLKPRGYAGDYEMLARFYERRLCDDPLGRLFDRYFQDQPAPRAVENRMRMMADWIVAAAHENKSARLRVALVGSAFGLEIRDALLRLDADRREQVSVTLLDLDPAAIEFARQQLAPLLATEKLTAVSGNLFRLPERPQLAALLDGSDLIFCPGLFDYLDDAAATTMLRALYGRLAPGGRLSVFQFAPHDPTRAYMEWIGNWYLTYRDVASFQAYVQNAQLDQAQLAFGAEPLGVDLFVTASRC